jgi:hypothetical protein
LIKASKPTRQLRNLLAVTVTAGAPACVKAALDRTMMTGQQAVHLCRGSRTTRPVACFEAGSHQTLLGTHDLVDLCAPVVRVRPSRPS